LVAWENLFLEVGRLQFLPHQHRDPEQSAQIEPWVILDA
jgi:hypothetical protein